MSQNEHTAGYAFVYEHFMIYTFDGFKITSGVISLNGASVRFAADI